MAACVTAAGWGAAGAPAAAQTKIEADEAVRLSSIAQIGAGMGGSFDGVAGAGAGSGSNAAQILQIGDGNAVAVTQEGRANTARVAVHGDDTGRVSGRDAAVVLQRGEGNGALIGVQGRGNDFAVDQRGLDNQTVLTQHALPGSGVRGRATIVQDGRGNRVAAHQVSRRPGFGALSVDNSLSVQQTGEGHRLEAWQDGNANSGEVAQTGRNNTALLHQTGERNDSSIHQTGVGLHAESVQIGNDTLPVVIRQTTGTSPAVIVTRRGGT